jgi:DNA repair exonuclease SbcCD ATPase subunit
MSPIINRYALLVVISLSAALVLSGCSALTGNPREQANDAIAEANERISEHNELFEQARSTYSDARENIESGEEPSEEEDRITEAKETLQEARDNLDEARESLQSVEDLDVASQIKEYARLLTEAMDVQLSAEAKEIEFYEILELDPALENNRQKANDLLSETGDDYERADEAYARAREFADSHPNLIESPPREDTIG